MCVQLHLQPSSWVCDTVLHNQCIFSSFIGRKMWLICRLIWLVTMVTVVRKQPPLELTCAVAENLWAAPSKRHQLSILVVARCFPGSSSSLQADPRDQWFSPASDVIPSPEQSDIGFAWHVQIHHWKHRRGMAKWAQPLISRQQAWL